MRNRVIQKSKKPDLKKIFRSFKSGLNRKGLENMNENIEFKVFDDSDSYASFLKHLFLNKINVIPLPARKKKPDYKWKKYQTTKVTNEEFSRWFMNKEIGKDINFAIICGKISENLFVIDIDEASMFNKLFKDHRKRLV